MLSINIYLCLGRKTDRYIIFCCISKKTEIPFINEYFDIIADISALNRLVSAVQDRNSEVVWIWCEGFVSFFIIMIIWYQNDFIGFHKYLLFLLHSITLLWRLFVSPCRNRSDLILKTIVCHYNFIHQMHAMYCKEQFSNIKYILLLFSIHTYSSRL